MDSYREEEEAQPVILLVSRDFPELESALAWLAERRVRCRIHEPGSHLMPLRGERNDPEFQLEVCDPRDFDHACELLQAYDELPDELEPVAPRLPPARSPWWHPVLVIVAIAVAVAVLGAL